MEEEKDLERLAAALGVAADGDHVVHKLTEEEHEGERAQGVRRILDDGDAPRQEAARVEEGKHQEAERVHRSKEIGAQHRRREEHPRLHIL